MGDSQQSVYYSPHKVQNAVLYKGQTNLDLMSKTFALFLLENANNGNDILAVLDDIVETTDTALWYT